ncbi:hypothetical protein JOC86_001156 [Bacillus pakistanensis]|uniref:Uncharacterized protein n=1 Tax=Rossellomorea pakistanensis TaxID=992288 RepID=A0ABS2N9W8_9BACI|nr:hypothetical protein [Bacillus pakistanensis]
MNMGLLVSEKEFVVGNIGHDCGLPDKVTGEFYPQEQVPHFNVDNKMNPSLFLEQYIKKDKIDFTNPQISFYLG